MKILEKLFKRDFSFSEVDKRVIEEDLLDKNELIKVLGFESDVVSETVNKVMKILKKYPASLKYHHYEGNGLWEHSFDVACKCVENLKKVKVDFSKEEKVLVFTTGLLHDVGKIAFYEVETRYNYCALLFDDRDIDIKVLNKQIQHKENAHADVSAMIAFSLLSDEVKRYDVNLLIDMFNAIRLHHSSVASDNLFLRVLKISDVESVLEDVESQVKELNNSVEEEQQKTVQNKDDKEDVQEKVEEKSDDLTTVFKEVLRQQLFYNLKKDYEFYSLSYDDKELICVVYPSSINKICESLSKKLNKSIHVDILLQSLKNILAFENVMKASIEGKNFKASRTLKVVCFDASKILDVNEFAFFESNYKLKKLSNLKATQVISE